MVRIKGIELVNSGISGRNCKLHRIEELGMGFAVRGEGLCYLLADSACRIGREKPLEAISESTVGGSAPPGPIDGRFDETRDRLNELAHEDGKRRKG